MIFSGILLRPMLVVNADGVVEPLISIADLSYVQFVPSDECLSEIATQFCRGLSDLTYSNIEGYLHVGLRTTHHW